MPKCATRKRADKKSFESRGHAVMLKLKEIKATFRSTTKRILTSYQQNRLASLFSGSVFHSCKRNPSPIDCISINLLSFITYLEACQLVL